MSDDSYDASAKFAWHAGETTLSAPATLPVTLQKAVQAAAFKSLDAWPETTKGVVHGLPVADPSIAPEELDWEGAVIGLAPAALWALHHEASPALIRELLRGSEPFELPRILVEDDQAVIYSRPEDVLAKQLLGETVVAKLIFA